MTGEHLPVDDRVLRESEDRYRRLVELSTDGIAIYRDRKLVYINPAGASILGSVTADELGGRTMLDFVHVDDQEPVRSASRAAQVDSNQAGAIEARLVRPDGKIVEVELTFIPIQYQGEPAAQVIARDISTRKRAEASLRAAEARYRSIFENAVEGMFQSTLDGRYLAVNPALAHMYGYATPEDLMSGVFDIEQQVYVERKRRVEFMQLMSEQDVVLGFESQVQRQDGRKIWISENARAVRDEAGQLQYFEGSVVDITQQRHLEEQLLRAQRLEAAGRVAGQVAHDLANLVAPLAGYPELLKLRLPEGDPGQAYCDRMLRAAQHIVELNEELLTLARRGQVQFRSVELNSVVSYVATTLVDVPGTLDVDVQLAPWLPELNGSAVQLVRVVTNLVSNAREAMEDRGCLRLRTAHVVIADDPTVAQPAKVPAGQYAVVTVEDTGPGIPPEVFGRMFDEFFTTKTDGGQHGTGLGLSIVRAVVEDHQGQLHVETLSGQGTRFQIYLPARG